MFDLFPQAFSCRNVWRDHCGVYTFC